MNLRQFADGASRTMDSIAAAVVTIVGWFVARRTVRLVEEDGGAFATRATGRGTGAPLDHLRIVNGHMVGDHADALESMLRGSRAELVLRPGQFLFRPLELPERASEFLDGVVRAQIDRLTPWSAADAAFGWSEAVAAGPNRLVVTVASTARALLLPYVQALTALGAQSISVFTIPPDAGANAIPIKVLEQKGSGTLDMGRVRRALVSILVVSGLLAGVSIAAATVVAGNLGARQDDLARRIAERRAAIRGGRERADVAVTPLRALERRKRETPSSVVVLDVLSQILPDHTYVTELRVEGDKLRLVGLTRDAPGLIRLMEQSPHFTRATFFAPTTRAPADPGERFHIEARIEPVFAPGS